MIIMIYRHVSEICAVLKERMYGYACCPFILHCMEPENKELKCGIGSEAWERRRSSGGSVQFPQCEMMYPWCGDVWTLSAAEERGSQVVRNGFFQQKAVNLDPQRSCRSRANVFANINKPSVARRKGVRETGDKIGETWGAVGSGPVERGPGRIRTELIL